MNKITEWFKSLELEIIIILVLLFIGLILAVYIMIKNYKIYNAIAKKTLSAKEDLIHEDEVHKARVIVTNIGYTNTVVKELGFIYKKTKLPTINEEFNLSARNFHTTIIPIEELRTFVLGNNNKIKKFHFYVVDSINRTTKTKLKLSYKYIKKQINNENEELARLKKASKKAQKNKAKEVRYENGDYNFCDRFYLIITAIFSPLNKLFKFIAKKINQGLHHRQIKKQVKKELLERQKITIQQENLKQEEALREKTSENFSKKLDKRNEKRILKNEKKLSKNEVSESVESIVETSSTKDLDQEDLDYELDKSDVSNDIASESSQETILESSEEIADNTSDNNE